MERNEQSSPKVATYAAEILNIKMPNVMTIELWQKIKSIAASALTQTPNKKIPVMPTSKIALNAMYNALALNNQRNAGGNMAAAMAAIDAKTR
jgi:hypothetical protein